MGAQNCESQDLTEGLESPGFSRGEDVKRKMIFEEPMPVYGTVLNPHRCTDHVTPLGCVAVATHGPYSIPECGEYVTDMTAGGVRTVRSFCRVCTSVSGIPSTSRVTR